MNGPPPARDGDRNAVRVLLALVLAALLWILLPFWGTILWAAIIALLFTPLNRWLLARWPGRRSSAALLTVLVVSLIGVLPFLLVTAALTREAAALYQRLQSGELKPALYFRGLFDALPGWVDALLLRGGLADFDALQRRLEAGLAQGTQYFATQAFSIGQNTFDLAASLCITLYLAFFLLRDGATLVQALRAGLPLAPAHQQELLDKFITVVRATVKGNLLVALIQGALGGLAFWWLGVGAALLWAVLMAFLSLLPAVGAALVWAPVAVYFLVNGALWQGLALIAWGVLVIGLIDNVLRPVLVGKDTHMPDYAVMITTLGGMAVFGLNGFVIGPVVAAMAMAVWHIHLDGLGQAAPPA